MKRRHLQLKGRNLDADLVPRCGRIKTLTTGLLASRHVQQMIPIQDVIKQIIEQVYRRRRIGWEGYGSYYPVGFTYFYFWILSFQVLYGYVWILLSVWVYACIILCFTPCSICYVLKCADIILEYNFQRQIKKLKLLCDVLVQII